MRFRNLDYGENALASELGPAALDALLERGDLDAWAPLARAVRDDPHGSLAATVERICLAHPMYGTSALWLTFIERARAHVAGPPVHLAVVREAAGLTQDEVAERLSIGQSDVSRLERRADVRVSSLRRYLEACGATLHIEVEIPGRLRRVALRFGATNGKVP